MKFIDEVTEYLKANPEDVWDLPGNLGCAFVESEVHDERRWYDVKHTVFQKKTLLKHAETGALVGEEDEYVLVEHCEPATELQEGGDFPEPEAFAVEPYETTVVKYRPV
jgi:hypothetical protein